MLKEDILECKFCNHQYDSEKRCPRMLVKCGHSICENCLIKCAQKNIPVVCFDCEDSPEYPPTYNIDENFPKNIYLL